VFIRLLHARQKRIGLVGKCEDEVGLDERYAREFPDKGQTKETVAQIKQQRGNGNLYQWRVIDEETYCKKLGRPGVYGDAHERGIKPVESRFCKEETEGYTDRYIAHHNGDGLLKRLPENRIYFVIHFFSENSYIANIILVYSFLFYE